MGKGKIQVGDACVCVCRRSRLKNLFLFQPDLPMVATSYSHYNFSRALRSFFTALLRQIFIIFKENSFLQLLMAKFHLSLSTTR